MDATTMAYRVWQSYQRCVDNYVFVQDFYQRFIESSPLIADRFAGTDVDHQVLMLRASLELLLAGGIEAAGEQGVGLRQVAELHSRRKLDIPPELYDDWLDSLLLTVRTYDSHCNARLEQEWRVVLKPGIDYMKGVY